MPMLTSTIAGCTPCVERARSAHSFTLVMSSHLMAQVLSKHFVIHGHIHGRTSFDSLLPFYFYLFLPVFLRLLPPQRAALRARQPDRHGKPVPLRQQGEWGRLRRLHFLHSFSNYLLDSNSIFSGRENEFRDIFLSHRTMRGTTFIFTRTWNTTHSLKFSSEMLPETMDQIETKTGVPKGQQAHCASKQTTCDT